jgi:hypothetical protein
MSKSKKTVIPVLCTIQEAPADDTTIQARGQGDE